MTSSKIEKGGMLNAGGKKEADGWPGREGTKGFRIPVGRARAAGCAVSPCPLVAVAASWALKQRGQPKREPTYRLLLLKGALSLSAAGPALPAFLLAAVAPLQTRAPSCGVRWNSICAAVGSAV